MTCTLGLPGCNPAASRQQIRLGRAAGCGPSPVEPIQPASSRLVAMAVRNVLASEGMAEDTADPWCDAVAARGERLGLDRAVLRSTGRLASRGSGSSRRHGTLPT